MFLSTEWIESQIDCKQKFFSHFFKTRISRQLDHEHASLDSDVLIIRRLFPFIRRSKFHRIRCRRIVSVSRSRNPILVASELDEPLSLAVVKAFEGWPEKLNKTLNLKHLMICIFKGYKVRNQLLLRLFSFGKPTSKNRNTFFT